MEVTFLKGREEGHMPEWPQQCDIQPAAHAVLAANGIVESASGRAVLSTSAAWDKGETIAW